MNTALETAPGLTATAPPPQTRDPHFDPVEAANAEPHDLHQEEETHDTITNGERLVTLAFVVVPFLGVVAAIALLWGVGVEWYHVATLVVMYFVTALGISVGYHRLFSHRAFKTPAFMRAYFAITGAMAAEGSVRRFVANHRRHHSHSDRPGDPHSPHHEEGEGVWHVIKGFWYAHMGWFLQSRPHPDEAKYAPEFSKLSGKPVDKAVTFVDKTNGLWVAVGLILPGIICGLIGQSWMSAALGVLWGGIVRIFVVHHVTFSVNSVCHLWGTRPFRSGDHSRNNAIFGWLGVGEGWHNNHHAFPYSARHGLRWWEFDVGYIMVKALEMIGLASDVRVPAKAGMDKAKNH